MRSRFVHRQRFCLLVALLLVCVSVLHAQHGVVRDYAAFAPDADAVALRPLMDFPLTDTSIALGPDGAYYLTGSQTRNGAAVGSPEVTIWRSRDLKNWRTIRTLSPGTANVLSPEIHFLQNSFWLTLETSGGGTQLLKFDTRDLATSSFKTAAITSHGITPSLFLDDDGSFFWVMGVGRIARMKPNPMDGLAEEFKTVPVRIAGPPGQQRDQNILGLRGAHLAKIDGKYHLFVTGKLKRNGLGRTGLADGVDDVLVAASEKPDEGYSDFYVAFPNAGQTTLFTDPGGALWATWSCNDERGILRGVPAAFKVERVLARDPAWPIGFGPTETPTRFPFNLMLRPETRWIYERGMGFARPIPLDKVPGQRSKEPWIRDTFIMVGHDGNYYLTGTAGNMDGIHLWRSRDLKHFEYVDMVWTADKDPERWYNDNPRRLFWAPELFFIKGTYWIPFSVSTGNRGKNSLLKSTSGKPEGPYELAFPQNEGVDEHIDSSLFQDDDGSVYYVWQDGLIRKLNDAMNGFDGEQRKLLPTDGQRVGYEGATLVKIGKWYVLTAAEWNGGGNRSDGTYDMMYSCSTNLLGPYHPRRVAVPHAGHGALFKDRDGRWNASLFGNDRTAPFRAMPGFVPVEIHDSGDDLRINPDLP
jgi:beta-xylosidase